MERPVPQKQFRLVARAQNERSPASRVIVKDRHPLARHLVPPSSIVRVGKALEVGIDLRRDIHDQRLNGAFFHDQLRMGSALGVGSAVRHQDREDILRTERLGGQHGAQGGIHASGKPHHHPFKPDLFHLVANEGNEDLAKKGDVCRNLYHGTVLRSQ